MTNAVDAPLPAVNDLLRRAIRTSLFEPTDLRDGRASVARARITILRSIEVCMGALTDLKTSLNSLTAIGRIPNKGMVHIMGCAARSSFDSIPATSSNLKSDQHPLHWIRLTHVCRTWRAVALETPALWGHLHYTREDVFLKLLARSKQAPLYMRAMFPAIALLRSFSVHSPQSVEGLTGGGSFTSPVMRSPFSTSVNPYSIQLPMPVPHILA